MPRRHMTCFLSQLLKWSGSVSVRSAWYKHTHTHTHKISFLILSVNFYQCPSNTSSKYWLSHWAKLPLPTNTAVLASVRLMIIKVCIRNSHRRTSANFQLYPSNIMILKMATGRDGRESNVRPGTPQARAHTHTHTQRALWLRRGKWQPYGTHHLIGLISNQRSSILLKDNQVRSLIK
jgi:hypothetical protein